MAGRKPIGNGEMSESDIEFFRRELKSTDPTIVTLITGTGDEAQKVLGDMIDAGANFQDGKLSEKHESAVDARIEAEKKETIRKFLEEIESKKEKLERIQRNGEEKLKNVREWLDNCEKKDNPKYLEVKREYERLKAIKRISFYDCDLEKYWGKLNTAIFNEEIWDYNIRSLVREMNEVEKFIARIIAERRINEIAELRINEIEERRINEIAELRINEIEMEQRRKEKEEERRRKHEIEMERRRKVQGERDRRRELEREREREAEKKERMRNMLKEIESKKEELKRIQRNGEEQLKHVKRWLDNYEKKDEPKYLEVKKEYEKLKTFKRIPFEDDDPEKYLEKINTAIFNEETWNYQVRNLVRKMNEVEILEKRLNEIKERERRSNEERRLNQVASGYIDKCTIVGGGVGGGVGLGVGGGYGVAAGAIIGSAVGPIVGGAVGGFVGGPGGGVGKFLGFW